MIELGDGGVDAVVDVMARQLDMGEDVLSEPIWPADFWGDVPVGPLIAPLGELLSSFTGRDVLAGIVLGVVSALNEAHPNLDNG